MPFAWQEAASGSGSEADVINAIDCSLIDTLGCCLLEAVDVYGADEMERVIASLASALACPNARNIVQRCPRPVACVEPPVPVGMGVACSGNFAGDVCHVSCSAEPSTVSALTCNDQGSWVGQWPQCPGR